MGHSVVVGASDRSRQAGLAVTMQTGFNAKTQRREVAEALSDLESEFFGRCPGAGTATKKFRDSMGSLTPFHEPPKSREVLECASPLALWLGPSGRVESARGLAHSKTLARGRWFMGSKRELSVGGILTPAPLRGEGRGEG